MTLRRALLSAGLAGAAGLLSGCGPEPPRETCIQPVLIHVGDTAWRIPPSLRPSLPVGTYVPGRVGEVCPPPGQAAIVADHFSVLGSTGSPPGAPPILVNVIVEKSRDPVALIADRPKRPYVSPERPLADDAAEKAGYALSSIEGLRVFTAKPGGAAAFPKIVCSQQTPSSNPAEANAPNASCSAFLPYSAGSVVEIDYFDHAWPIQRTADLRRAVEAFLKSIRQ